MSELIKSLHTEKVDPRYVGLDTWPSTKVAQALLTAQIASVTQLQSLDDLIANAADDAAKRLATTKYGRLIYAGCGSSGRVGTQDGSELPPTYDWPTNRLAYVIAGGMSALTHAAEGAEDDIADGKRQIDALNVTADDVFIGIAASGTTPFTLSAAKAAKEKGALVIAVVNNQQSPMSQIADHAIESPTGGEVIAGSTRMSAATSQKIVLNVLSTLIMVRLHRVYDNLMVNLASSNIKLNIRRIGILQAIVDADEAQAASLLEQSGNDIKIAALMYHDFDKTSASALLEQHQGNLRAALATIG